MARLAEQLGRRFEARVFLTLAISEDPDREDLRHDLERLGRVRQSRPPGTGRCSGGPSIVYCDGVFLDPMTFSISPCRHPKD